VVFIDFEMRRARKLNIFVCFVRKARKLTSFVYRKLLFCEKFATIDILSEQQLAKKRLQLLCYFGKMWKIL
jgi:hypothetical protein